MSEYAVILTNQGRAKIAQAAVTKSTVELAQIAVSSGENNASFPVDENQTELKNIEWRGAINHLHSDENNPYWIIAETQLPDTVGGFFIRNIGLYDAAGDLIAIGKFPESYKPKMEEGSAKQLLIKMILEVSNVEAITLLVDPSIVMASRAFVEDHLKNALDDHQNNANAHKPAILQLIAENAPDLSGYIPRLTAAAPLPTQPIGVIWHDAYASLMFWREFTQNGANYKGYASVNLSQLIMPTFNEIPAGTLKVGINVEINDFPALYNGYRHFGQLVAPDIWAAGTLAVCDNGNGTFKMIDLRGWTARFFSDGSQVDAGRVAGSAQKSTTLSTRPLSTDINENQGEIILDIKNPDTIKILPFAPFQKSTTYSSSQQAQECGFRVANTAFFACVKF